MVTYPFMLTWTKGVAHIYFSRNTLLTGVTLQQVHSINGYSIPANNINNIILAHGIS
jgi:hypothetical protein